MSIWQFHLHWGWNPVIFFVFLAVALFVAVKAEKKRVAWVLPALVLYFGLEWALPFSWLFKLVFWIVVIIAVATAVLPGPSRLSKVPLQMMSALIALIIVLSGINWMFDAINGDGSQPSDNPSATSTDEPTETPTATPTEETCPPRFSQQLDPNRQYRFVSDGFEGSAREKRQQLVTALGHDYRYLDFFAEQLFKRSFDEESLVEGECLSEAGQDLHSQVKGALMASGVKNGEAPANAYNTGMQGGQAVVSETRGIYGDRSATFYTLADGTRLIVLDRCGNMVFPGDKPDLPPGETDNPPPPDDDDPPPTPKCPPGQYGTPPNCKDGPEGIPDNTDGNGSSENGGPGEPNPSPTFPSSPHTPPAPPQNTDPPKDSTPAPPTQSTPPPEDGANPDDGSGNTGDPGGW